MINRSSWTNRRAGILCIIIVIFALAGRLSHKNGSSKRQRQPLMIDHKLPIGFEGRKSTSRRKILRALMQTGIATAAILTAYAVVKPTWNSPAEFERPIGFIQLRASCPGVEAVPSVVISNEGQRIEITVDVYRQRSACATPRLMLDLYGSAMISHPKVDDPSTVSISGPHLAEFYVRSTHPAKAIGLLTISYLLPQDRPDTTLYVAGQYGSPEHSVRTSGWKSWRGYTPDLWVQCTLKLKWTPETRGFPMCPRDGHEDPQAATGIYLNSSETVQQASQPSDYPLGTTQYVHYKDMRSLAKVPTSERINTWSDPNSIHGQYVEVNSLDREQQTALRYLIAGALLGLSGGFMGSWI